MSIESSLQDLSLGSDGFYTDDVHAHYGRHLIESINNELRPLFPNLPPATPGAQAPGIPQSVLQRLHRPADNALPIGIVGSGAAGMYSALIFDSLGIKYEILEATDRVGGRIITYRFPKKQGQPPPGTYDYFDLGPMRFPQTWIMKRLFNLFNYRPLNTGTYQLAKHIIPYYYTTKDGGKAGNAFILYNDRRFRLNAIPANSTDPLRAKEVGVQQVYINAGWRQIFDDSIIKFVRELERDMENPPRKDGWDYLMQFDSHSTRSYLCHAYRPSASLGIPIQPLPTNVVNWMESLHKTTGWYDCALATMVLEEMAFGFTAKPNPPPVKFACLDGGTDVLSYTMSSYIQKQTNNKGILLNKRVTAISIANPRQGTNSPMNVNVVGESRPRQYSHVISTLPLPALRFGIDISGTFPPPALTNAIREMQYTPAVKIGIRFTESWWTTGVDRDRKTIGITGGLSFTDRPVRVVVYPSYGLNRTGPAVLIACFVWTDDGARIGGLTGTGKKEFEDQLKDLCLKDLAVIHNVDIGYLNDRYLDHYAYAYQNNPMSLGAFALFGAGKYSYLYKSLISPNGRLHFAGEACSVRHGWIEGALNSAWRCCYEILCRSYPDKLPAFYRIWGFDEEWLRPKCQMNHRAEIPVANEHNLLLEHIVLGEFESQSSYETTV